MWLLVQNLFYAPNAYLALDIILLKSLKVGCSLTLESAGRMVSVGFHRVILRSLISCFYALPHFRGVGNYTTTITYLGVAKSAAHKNYSFSTVNSDIFVKNEE